jgi:hypothetical protein
MATPQANTVASSSVDNVVVAPPAAQVVNEQEVASQRRRRMRIIAGVILGGIMLYLLYRSMKRTKENQTGSTEGGPLSRLLGGILGFDRSGDSRIVRDAGPGPSAAGVVPRHPGVANQMPDFGLEKETDESLAQLAQKLKNAGFTLQGVSHCKWTKIQREMFGAREAKARKILESIYIECRGEDMCPGLSGYPSWVRGDRKWAGFQPPAKLRAMATEMEKLDPTPMLQGAPEPISENIPDAKHNAEIPEQLTPEMAKDMMYQMAKDLRAGASAGEVAAVESDRSGAGVPVSTSGGVGVGAETTAPAAPASGPNLGQVAPAGAAGAQTKPPCKEGIKKEYARGVSAYAPLNVPDMPGTAPMNLDLQHADFQNRQGNVPRAAQDNHAPMAELARQVVQSFNNLSEHAHRDPMASSFSQTRLPHSADITTGDPLADKRLPVPQNPK